MKIFDYVANINKSKDDIWDINSPSEYSQVMVNKALSFHIDTIYYAEKMNRARVSDKMHYDFLRLAVPKSNKRFTGKWEKEIKEEEIKLIQEAFKCNYINAAQYRNLLNNKGISRIREFLYKGGSNES